MYNLGLFVDIEKALHLFTICFSLSGLHSQALANRHFDAESGLPSSEVYKVFNDQSGMLWICTDRGVSRYNSYKFETIETETPGSDLVFLDGYCEQDGTCWFQSMKNNYYFFNGKYLQPYKYNSLINSKYPGKYVGFMAHVGNDTYFELVDMINSLGVLRVHDNKIDTVEMNEKPSAENFSQFNTLQLKLFTFSQQNNNPILSVHYIKEKLPTGFEYRNGIGMLTIPMLEEQKQIYGKAFRIHCHRVDSNYILVSYQNTMYLAGIKNNTLYQFENNVLFKSFQTAAVRHNTIYIGFLNNGLYQFSLKDKVLKKIPELENTTVTSIHTDKENNLWLSTTEKGIYFFPFTEIRNSATVTGNIRSMLFSNNKLYLGLKDGSFGFIDKTGVFKIISHSKIEINTLAALPGGLILFDGNTFQENVIPAEPQTYFFKGVQVDHDSVYAIQSEVLSTFGIHSKVASSRYNLHEKLFCLYHSDSRFYVGCNTGLIVIDHKTGKWVKSPEIQNRVTCIRPFGSMLLLGTLEHGIQVFNPSTGKIVSGIDTKNGLSSNVINQLFFQNANTLWVATNNGLNRLRLKPGSLEITDVMYMDRSNGLPGNEVNAMVFDGMRIWVGTSKGLCNFIPAALRIPEMVQVVVIEGISTLQQQNKRTKQSEFEYNENNLLISFSSFSMFREINQPTFEYALLHNNQSDTVWNKTSETSLQFTNLLPGDYRFLIRARNRYSGKKFKISSYHFVIHRHFSQTWWFRSLIAGLILFLVFFFYRRRMNVIRDRESLNRRIKQAELDTLKSQMNPHFIFNALNSIQNIIFKNNPDKASYYLVTFSRIFREMLNNSGKDFITIKEEIDFLTRYLEIEKLRFGEDMEYEIVCDPEILQGSLEVPPLLMQPLVENAVKHGLKHVKGKGLIRIQFSVDGEVLMYSVSDNGDGFQPRTDVGHVSKGMSIVRDRLDILNQTNQFRNPARLAIHNEPGKGVTCTLYLPLELCMA